jgi:hypothetical protein
VAKPPPQSPRTVVGHRHPETARLAARRALPRSGSLKRSMYDLLMLSRNGKTDDELEFSLARPHQTVSAMRNALMNDGWVVDSGLRRKTRHGFEAIVWTGVTASGLVKAIEEEDD